MRRAHVLVRTLVYLHHQIERAALASELSTSQYLMLHFLHEGPRRAMDFAAMTGFRRPSVSSVVAGLEKRGLIERSVDPDDGRAFKIEITAEGVAAFDAFETLMQQELESFLGASEVRSIDRELGDFYDHWNERRVSRFERWIDSASAREAGETEQSEA